MFKTEVLFFLRQTTGGSSTVQLANHVLPEISSGFPEISPENSTPDWSRKFPAASPKI
jgi:hypothetical protein